MALRKPIVISDWLKGMSVSPYGAFAQMRGLDPHRIEGIVTIEFAPTPVVFSITQPSLINWTISDKAGVIYFLDNTGKLFSSSSYFTGAQVTGNTTSSATGNGLAYWKNYVFVARNGVVDAYLSPTWTSSLATLEVSRSGVNPLFVAQDDVFYIGNGRYVATITENAGQIFDPSNSATFTFAATAIKLPQDYAVVSFSELGDKLMAGTIFGTPGATTNVKISDIFPIDRVNLNYSLPIRLDDEGINSLLTSNNLLYISSGLKGNLSISNGVSVSELLSVPLDVKERDSVGYWALSIYPDAFDFWGDELFIGVSNISASGQTINPFGVYGLKGKTMRFLGNISAGVNGSSGTRVQITSIYAVSPSEFFVSWASDLTYGVDFFTSSVNRIGSYGAYAETELYFIGSEREPATLEYFDFILKKPLASGDGIRLSYRESGSGDYTTIVTFDFATHGAVSYFSHTISIPNLKIVQFKIEMTCTSTAGPQLRAIIIQ